MGAQAAALHQLYDTALKCLTVKKKGPQIQYVALFPAKSVCEVFERSY